MKTALVTMLLITLLVAGFTIAYKSAQSLMFIKPGGEVSLFSFGTAAEGGGLLQYAILPHAWQREKGISGLPNTSHVFEIVHDPGNAQNVYAATSTGLYYYEGTRQSWTYLAGGRGSQILSVSVNAKNASDIFIATVQRDGTSALGRSSDAGKTFVPVYASLTQNEKIVEVIDDWFAPQRVFALSDQGTFLRSDDEGSSWRVAYRFNRNGTTRLIMDPNDSRILYVLQPSIGMLVSTNSGDSWKSEEHAFASFLPDAKKVNALRTVTGLPGHLYLATDYGILRSENRGKSFTLVPSLMGNDSAPFRAIELGKDSQTLFAAAGNIVYESHDQGKNWETHVVSDARTITLLTYLGFPEEKIFIGL